jgi:hypothetical protein
MEETILRKVVSGDDVARQLAQEVPDLRLVPPDQFPECCRVL